MAAKRKTTLPLLLTALVALVALAALVAALWLVFFAAPPATVGDEPTLMVPGDPMPAPMPKPAPPATRPTTAPQ